MPMYDFTCSECGFVFEELASANETKTPKCPKCGSKNTSRNLSCPSPLKTGAFPYKIGPTRPLSTGSRGTSCGMK